jgi:hypothetical protein
MATQEERITNLEQFQRETIAAVQESNLAITAQMGIVSEQEKDIKRTLAVVEQQTELLMQHSAILLQHSEAIRELLARLPAKE